MNDEFSREEEQLQQKTRLLSEFFEQEPSAKEDLERIINRYLSEEVINHNTRRLLTQSLILYAGQDNADFLLGLIMTGIDMPEFIAKLKEYLNPELWKFIRNLSALYGGSVQKVYLDQDNILHSWKTTIPKINYEAISDQWFINLIIEKFNGEKTLYIENPSTLMELADTLLDALLNIPEAVAPKTIDQETLIHFKERCDNFFELFTSSDVSDQE